VATQPLPEVVQAAIDRLRDLGDARLRPALLERWTRLQGRGARTDGGAGVRTALLRGLRAVAEPDDLPLFEAAALQVELAPLRGDVAQDLRAAALLGVAALDVGRACWYAAHLLADQEHVSRITGEPALTAARLLVSLDRGDLLYLALRRGQSHPEVRAECVRQLADLPGPLLSQLAAPILAGDDEPALLGLIDLALCRPDLRPLLPELRRWMRETKLLDVYRYFVTAAAASRRDEALELLREERRLASEHKLAFLEGALELV
jgi:hypothetical protein